MKAASAGPFDVISETRRLLATHGKDDWGVGWDGAKRRAGATHYGKKMITYSRHLTSLYPPMVMREVVLHEVAHALVGPKHGHDQVWVMKVRELGGAPSRTLPATLPTVSAKWKGVCPKCGATRQLHSAPRRVVSCGQCSSSFDRALVFVWYRDGAKVTPPGKYRSELRRLTKR